MKVNLENKAIVALSGLLVAVFVSIFGLIGCANNGPEASLQIIRDVTPQEAYDLIQDNQGNRDFIIIDVRTPEERESGYIENAINLDFYSVAFREELEKLDKDRTYLIYCRSGRRSQGALDMMEELGFREVYNLSGGMLQWEREGLPTVK